MPVTVLPVPETGVTPNQARLTWNNQGSALANEINSHEASGAVAHGGRYSEAVFAYLGTLAVQTGRGKYRVRAPGGTITEIVAELNIAASAPGVTFDVLKNGVSLYTTKPNIATGTTELVATLPTSPTLATGDILTVGITGIGSPTAGDTLTAIVRIQQ